MKTVSAPKILGLSAAWLVVMSLAGCYYPVYQYPPYPGYPSQSYPYGYAPPAPQGPAGMQAYPGMAPHQECREYHQPTTIDGKMQDLVGTACRQPDGSWKDSANGSPIDMEHIPGNAAPAPTMPVQSNGLPPYGSPPPQSH